MTMSIHKLSAGSGYDYLTRQVAALDATHKGRIGLVSYYTERGKAPGVWVGSGIAGIDGLDAGDVVTADDRQAPLVAARLATLVAAGLDGRKLLRQAAAGGPLPVTIPPQHSGGGSSTSYQDQPPSHTTPPRPHRRRNR
jgi:hypothetical protein